jgi:MSHA pilin protein MshD
MCTKRRHAGLTLIELLMFIVIVGMALAGVLSVLNTTVKSSADPVLRKNMLSIAESLLEEVQRKPFTWCDPDDASAATAQSAFVGATGCATTMETAGPEAGETRTSATTPFDNVNDYNGLALASPIASVTGNSFAPDGYSASIAVANDAGLGPSGLRTASDAVLRITVTVTRGGDSVVLEGYRTRYSPNTLP